MEDPSITVVRLWPTARAPGEARAALRNACTGLPPEVVTDASLLLSELVTNACQHAHGTVTVAVTTDGGHIGVAVHDNDLTLPPEATQRQMSQPEHERGRGLAIVATIASRFGIRPAADGKTFWFRVP
jgi:anti-sigma regulatory factor (Ser/Thr protein kinase)